MKLPASCTTPLTPTPEATELAAAFRALSSPHRLAMYLKLLEHSETSLKSCALQELIDRLDIGAPTISHHVKELVSAGLISVERDGKYLRCSLDEAMRARLAGALSGRTG